MYIYIYINMYIWWAGPLLVGPLWDPMGSCGPPWALVGRALVGRPLWAPPHPSGPHGLAFVGLALVGRAPGPL